MHALTNVWVLIEYLCHCVACIIVRSFDHHSTMYCALHVVHTHLPNVFISKLCCKLAENAGSLCKVYGDNLHKLITALSERSLRGVVWCGVVWCGVVWCGVVWCGVVWCGVVWCGVCLMCIVYSGTSKQWTRWGRVFVHYSEVVPSSEVLTCIQLLAGGTQFVHCREVVRSSECPLSEFPLYSWHL